MSKERRVDFITNKKGLSPVVATVLLIMLVIILAVIIFLWARQIVPEAITKFGNPIASSCGDVSFEADVSGGNIEIQNNGNVPIYGITVLKSGFFGSRKLASFDDGTLTTAPGSSSSFATDLEGEGEAIVVPILLGTSSKTDVLKAYVCDKSTGKTVTL